MFPSGLTRGIAFILVIIVFIGCSGCFSEPVKSGPPIKTTVVPATIDGRKGIKSFSQNAKVSAKGEDTEKTDLLTPQWDQRFTNAIPSGFVCVGAFRKFPASLSFDGVNLPLMLSSASVGRIVDALRNKASKGSASGNLSALFHNKSFAFALMPVGGKELARFVLITVSGGEFEALVRSFPVNSPLNAPARSGEVLNPGDSSDVEEAPGDGKAVNGSVKGRTIAGDFPKADIKDHHVYSLGTDLSVNVAVVGDLLVVASDSEIVGGVQSALNQVSVSITGSPLSSAFRPLVSKDALGYVYCDLPAMVGSTPGFASVKGAVAVAAGPSSLKKSKLFSSVRGSLIEVSLREDSSLDIQGIVLKKEDEIPAQESVVGTRIAGETVDAMLSLSLNLESLFENEKELISYLPDSIASMFQAAVDRSKSTISAGGIDFNKEVRPFVGSELSLILSWKIKYPQLAILLKIKDSTHWVTLMSRLRSHLEDTGYVFASRKVGDQHVYFTREQSISAEVFEPSFVITPQFLILASGRHVLESILLDQEKLEGTELLSGLFRKFNGAVDNLFYFNTDLLGRFVESGERRVRLYSHAAHGQCNANMVQIKATGKATMFCPAGGGYEINGDSIACSLHGTVNVPLDPAGQIRDSLKAVKDVQQKYMGLAVGTSRQDGKNTRFRLILKGRPSDAPKNKTSDGQ